MRFKFFPALAFGVWWMGVSAVAGAAPLPAWIWSQTKPQGSEKVFFRSELELPAKAKGALLTISCDEWHHVYVNGVDVGMGGDWSTPRNYVIQPHLKAGRNVIAVEARNADGPAGLAVRIAVALEGGKTQHWLSDASWQWTREVEQGWQHGGRAKAGHWRPAVVVAKMGDKPWGKVIAADVAAAGGPEDMTAEFQLPDGFKLERLHQVPNGQGSWVGITRDDRGRFYCSDQHGKIYQVEAGAGARHGVRVKPLVADVKGAHGLLWHRGVLWVCVAERGSESGVWRVSDRDGDGELEHAELVKAIQGRGEHGAHSLVAAPDGESIYLIAGNHANLPPMDRSVVPQVWQEDQLLPRRPDARGHARTRMAPGGWIARFAPDGSDWELFSMGYRNTFDAAFNPQGDLITYDSDMEWDLGMPWYRPTRFCHVLPGSEFGWRNGTGKWPEHYEDAMMPLVEIGPGSPTGMVSGKGAKFPARYQRAVFGLDWTFATIYAVHTQADGHGYQAKVEEFLTGERLPVTDAVIGMDGAMYFLTGGRKTDSAMWRISYVGEESTAPVAYASKPLEPMAIAEALKHLGSPDRLERYAARTALELQGPKPLRELLARSSANPWEVLGAALGLARAGQSEDAPAVLGALDRLAWPSLDQPQKLAWLRTASVLMARHGKRVDEVARQRVLAKIDASYPASDETLNRELCRVLSYLQAPGVVARTLNLMDSAGPTPPPNWMDLAERNANYGRTVKRMMSNMPPAQVIHYVYCLRVVKGPWRGDERKRFFAWIAKLSSNEGGNSYAGFIRDLRKETLSSCTPQEVEVIATFDQAAPPNPFANLPPIQGPGRQWTVDEIVRLSDDLQASDPQKGKAMFRGALCAGCHRMGGEGGSAGPDLTGLAGRFSARDLAVAILEPSQTISDQYAFDLVMRHDGTSLVGKIVEEKDEKWLIATNPYDMSQTVEIERSEIKEVKSSPVSPMPPGLIHRMNENELKALLGYLLHAQ